MNSVAKFVDAIPSIMFAIAIFCFLFFLYKMIVLNSKEKDDNKLSFIQMLFYSALLSVPFFLLSFFMAN